MNESLIEIKTDDGNCEAYVLHPSTSEKNFQTVLIYMDAVGIRPTMVEVARNLAGQGYLVMLPNLFYRTSKIPVVQGLKEKMTPEDMGKIAPQFGPLMKALPPELLLKDAYFYLEYLRNHEKAKLGKAAIVGYCFGGGHAVRTAAQYPDQVSAVASFHAGNLASDQPQSPHLLLSRVKAELYFAHADHDGSMPKEQIDRLEAALKENQNKARSEVYSGAHHGFTMKDLPAYNSQADQKHWSNLTALLNKVSLH